MEYVTELQHRRKWQNEQDTLEIGEMVLIREDNIPPLQWKLGRISALHPGPDKRCRVASIKTKCGELKRAISKICRFPTVRNNS
ncbi:hypothetical protein NQ314_015100 [Rhamnusium bicolor]|uniref:DUF5641 domain-containing protein n=1 Tax=Rhamnusium bicolor TaxID=1586634 RepID=A0AAV8WZV8_9CUCU|nr:hypothetical protein NQ314_015100 [Rhamnusium bicolor]